MNIQALANAVAGASPIIPEVLPVVAGRTVHIDADMMCYVGGGKEGTSVSTSRGIVMRMADKFKDAAQAEKIVMHLTASGCLKGDRVLVPTSQPYQGNRKSGRRPENWGYLRDWIGGYDGPAFKVKTWEDREADDGFGYISVARPGDVICTNDKDMRMLEGWHLDWVSLELFEVPAGCYELARGDKTYGFKWFLLQMLQGDSADHIRGLGKCCLAPRGCGPATAQQILRGAYDKASGMEYVVAAYKTAFDKEWADEFVEQAMLLWIRRGKSALVDEFAAFVPMATAADTEAIQAGIKKVKRRIKDMKEEAACLLRS